MSALWHAAPDHPGRRRLNPDPLVCVFIRLLSRAVTVRYVKATGGYMGLIALIAWLTTAGAGLYLLAVWLIEYDRDFQRAAATRLPIPVLGGHALLAVAGLLTWTAYLVVDDDRLAWAAVIILGGVAVLGLTMAVRWLAVYRATPAPARLRVHHILAQRERAVATQHPPALFRERQPVAVVAVAPDQATRLQLPEYAAPLGRCAILARAEGLQPLVAVPQDRLGRLA